MQFKTILVPTDFSPPSQQALEVASSLARAQHGRLIILHVMDLPVVYCDSSTVYMFPEEEVEEARGQLERAVPADRSIPVEHRLVKGEAAPSILKAAEDSSADLIVMGTHGNTGMMHLMLGSIAETVMRFAMCPVLAVKAPAEKLQTSPEPASLHAR